MRLADLEQYNPITIQCHDNPDADALGSAYGLYCYFRDRGKQVRMIYSGFSRIQKANLRMMCDKLKLPIEYVEREAAALPGSVDYGGLSVWGGQCDPV